MYSCFPCVGGKIRQSQDNSTPAFPLSCLLRNCEISSSCLCEIPGGHARAVALLNYSFMQKAPPEASTTVKVTPISQMLLHGQQRHSKVCQPSKATGRSLDSQPMLLLSATYSRARTQSKTPTKKDISRQNSGSKGALQANRQCPDVLHPGEGLGIAICSRCSFACS